MSRREDRRSEAVLGFVGPGDDVIVAVEAGDRHDRAEHLLLDDLVVLLGTDDDRRGDEETVGVVAFAASPQIDVSGRGGALQKAAHAVALDRRDHRPHLGALVVGASDRERLHRGHQGLDQVVMDLPCGVHPGRCHAVLARVAVAALDDLRDDELEVGVGEDDHRCFAAQFQVDALEVRVGGGPEDLPTGRDVAGERAHPHPRMADEADPDRVAVAGDDVEDALRKQITGELGKSDRGQRGVLGRFDDQRVTGHQRRADLPDRHQQGVVPGRDRTDDAERVTADHAGVAGEVLTGRTALEDPGGAGEEAEMIDDHLHLLLGEADRLADVDGLQTGELGLGRLEPVGELQQRPGAFAGGGLRPAREGGLGCRHRDIDVGRPGGRHLGDLLAGGGRHHHGCPAIESRPALSVDEHLGLHHSR